MNVFLTGGSGFIGSNLLNKLHSECFTVDALKRLKSKPRVKVFKKPKWIPGDLNTLNDSMFKNIDILIHLAAHSTNYPYDDLENCIYWNVTKSMEMLEKAYNAGVRKFLVAGSCFEYGRSSSKYDKIPVDAPLQPTNSYSVSKAMASIAMQYWAMKNACYFHYFRIFHVYGEGEEDSRLWPSLKKAAINGDDFKLTLGEQVRDFSSVDFITTKILEFTKFNNVKYGNPKLSNMGTGYSQTMKKFAKNEWKKMGAQGKLLFGSLPYRKDEIMRYVPLINK